MAALRLSFLGPPRIELDGVVITLQRRRAMALLAYLSVTGEPQPRERLAALFWPEYDHRQARAALRRDLSELNLASQWLQSNRESIALRAGYWVDVAQFQQHLAECAGHPAACRTALSAAADLYRGDFLAGFTLTDAPEFDEWQSFQAERLRQDCAVGLAQLVEVLSEQGEHAAAIAYTQRWLALDSLHEPAHRRLMQLYAQTDQQASALRQYEICRRLLAAELDVSPAPETTALFEQIRARKLAPTAATTQRPAVAAVRHHLPTQTTSFVGRQEELADLWRLLFEEPECRLLTLVGPGGVGKTRLALAAAAKLLDAFPDGVHFVALAPVGEVGYVVPAIADALHFSFFGSSDLKVQLLNYLGPKRLLLVIDNFEHLLEEANLLSAILTSAPGVTILATSRERLNLQEECVYDVHGLAFPTLTEEVSQDVHAYSALGLFTQRARQSAPTFAPSRSEMPDLIRLCQLVEGMPLALELAAPWARTLSCREIAEEIEQSLDFLTTTLRNVPERHRSLRVVFEQTWRRLSPAEQSVLMGLSIFRGGCTRQAAEQVANASLSTLSALADKALLHRTNTGRYELHELIRQFAESQLQTEPYAVEQVRRRHRSFFIAFLEAHTAGAKGRKQVQTLAEIEADVDNVRLAWHGAVAHREPEALERSAECLFVYYLYRNGYDEGVLEFGRAVAAFTTNPAHPAEDNWLPELIAPDQNEGLVAFLLAGLGYFVAHRRSLPKGQRLLEQALALFQRAPHRDPRKAAFTLLWLGWALYFQGQIEGGKRCARESLALFTGTADQWGEGWALLLLGGCLRDGRPAEAVAVYQTGLTLCRESGDQIVLSYLSYNMGAALTALGRYAQAQPYIDLGVTISEELNNILGLGYSLLRRGQWETCQGNYRQAIQTLQQAWTHFNKVGTVHASRAQLALGLAYHLQGDDDLAAQFYRQALGGFKAANNQLELTLCLNRLGCLAYDQGKLHQAEQLQRESLALLQETEPEPAMIAATLSYLGQVMAASDEHRHAEASGCFRQALELALEHQLAPLALDVCVDIVQLLTEAGEIEHALKLLALVEQQEASTFATRERARRHLLEFGEQARYAQARTVQCQEETPDLWAAVQTLLPRLATPLR